MAPSKLQSNPKQEMTGWQWHRLGNMQIICILLHASTSWLNILQTGCSSWCPANSIKTQYHHLLWMFVTLMLLY